MIKQLKGFRPQGEFIANVLTLMTGIVSAQAITILVIPIITRLYTPQDLGIFALFVSVVEVIAVVSCWRYEEAIVLPKEDQQAANILVLSVLIALGMSLLALVVMSLSIENIASFLGTPQLTFWLWFVPIAVICRGLNLTFSFWTTRKKQFRILAVSRTTEAITRTVAQMAAGLVAGSTAGGLIGGQILGIFLSTALLGVLLCGRDLIGLVGRVTITDIKISAITYRKFPYFLSWTGLLNRIAQQLPFWMFAYFYTRTIVGFYSLGNRVLSLPTTLITASIQRVYLQKAAELYAHGQPLRSSFRKSTYGLVAVGIIPFLALLLFGRALFAIAFGAEWHTAGLYAQIMSPWLFTSFICAPARTLFTVCQRQDVLLVYQILFTLFGALSILAAHYYSGTVESCILLFSAAGLAFNLGMVGYGYRLATTTPRAVDSPI